MFVTNNSGMSIVMAVWALHSEYDRIDEENYISVTGLMKPIRQIVLSKRVPANQKQNDVEDFVASSIGTALHDSIERAWTRGYEHSLRLLGYPEDMIKRVLINPTDEQLAAVEHPIPIYMEQREIRKIDGYSIGGKFDMIAEGILHDHKSTTAYTWLFGGKDADYQLQGSLYRWLNQKKITEDFIRIGFIFTDWQKMQALSNPKYPPKRLMTKDIPLLSLAETENWVKNKLSQITKFKNAPENTIPECTDEELWKSENQYKYYADPTKTLRATKNFDDYTEARKFMAEKGGKGIIITVEGKPKRCEYCDAFSVCTQKDKYFSATE